MRMSIGTFGRVALSALFIGLSRLLPAAAAEYTGGADDGWNAAVSCTNTLLGGSRVVMASTSTTFWRGVATAIPTISITDDSTPGITAANDLRITIPSGLNMTWETNDTTAALGGTGAGNVSGTVSYEDDGRTLLLDVIGNFGAGDTLTIGGLSFSNVVKSSSGRLTLDFDDDGIIDSEDTALLTIDSYGMVGGADDGWNAAVSCTNTLLGGFQVTMASLATTYWRGAGSTVIPTITVTIDSANGITAASDLRIRIPVGLYMTWDTNDVAALLGGTAAAKALASVSYEDGGRTLVIDVVTDFAAGDTLTISGLSFANILKSGTGRLTLDFDHDGIVDIVDSATLTIASNGMFGGADDGCSVATTLKEKSLKLPGVVLTIR